MDDKGTEIEQGLRITELLQPVTDLACQLPVFASSVQGGFPSPAEDYIEKQLDLNELMIQHPVATFYVRVEGDSMRDAGIHSGDILVVDRALKANSGKIIVAVIDGDFTVKRLRIRKGQMFLEAESEGYPDIAVKEGSDFQVWGVVTYVIHKAS